LNPALPPLSAKEKNRFEICKQLVRDGLNTVFDVGIALREMREGKYYREQYDTWNVFCEAEFKISRSYAHRLIESSQVKEELPKSVTQLVTTEAQARALSDIPEDQRAAVLKSAAKSGSVTAASITDAAEQMLPIGNTDQPIESGISQKKPASKDDLTKKPVLRDEKGYPIPEDVAGLWPRRQELQDLMSRVSAVKCQIEKALSEDDPLYRGIRNTILVELTGVHYQISRNKPYAVCTDCQGFPKVNKCRLCYGTGLIGKEAYENITAKEKREMRERKLELEKKGRR